MKEIIHIYKHHRSFIESTLVAMLEHIDITQFEKLSKNNLFSLLPALRSSYKIDANHRQSTPCYMADSAELASQGSDKHHLLDRVQFRDDNFYISNAYISSRTGLPSITVVLHTNDEYIVYDFELYALLKELSLINGNHAFTTYSKYMYALFGSMLAAFSIAMIVYAFYIGYHMFSSNELLSGLFRAIIAITLGLAIFDLSKTILEHEVFFKSLSKENNIENRLLARFLISIIVALSIEALMVVFKITLYDYSHMIHAFYLIAGIGILIVSLSIFIFIIRYKWRT